MAESKTIQLLPADEIAYMTMQLRQEMRDGFVMLKTHMIEKPLTRKGAAEYLGIGVKALDNRIQRGVIPSRLIHKNGGTPYFFASELAELLKKS